jgi:predicted nucleic-acid-binding protein
MGEGQMKVTADTNVLIRAAVQDDLHQARRAAKILAEADLVAVPVPVLCEFVWVLRRGYRKSATDVSDAIRRLMRSPNVVMNRTAVEAGLSALDAGGDFADGAIAHEGEWLGAEEFVSFDSKAVSLLQAQGSRARLLRSSMNARIHDRREES